MFRIRGIAILGLVFVAGCGGGGSVQQPPPGGGGVSITVTPSVATVPQGGSQSFFATVKGTSNTAVTWTVQEGAAGGSVTDAGLYTATTTPGTYHVVATSLADGTKHDTATVTVPQVSISISPTSVTVAAGGTRSFTATPAGSINTTVMWAVQEGAAGGTITNTGLYTAPATLGTFHVIATSDADPSKSATAVVTVANLSGSFSPTGSMKAVVGIHTATLLPDGRVLMAGGSTAFPGIFGDDGFDDAGHVDAELYDPVARSFSATGSMTSARTFHTASLLPNGKVLVTGGFDQGHQVPPTAPPQPEGSAELYDPATGSFTPAGTMGIARAVHTATLLPNGKVLIAGGGTKGGFGLPFFGEGIAESEVYDPATNSFTTTGAMGTPRYAHTATLLPNGKVLIAGGFSTSNVGTFTENVLLTAELYDPATGAFTPTGSLGTARGGHTATLLANGKVLVAGGLISLNFAGVSVASTAELYDPATGTFTPTGNLTADREEHTATLLPDGRVLIVGGASASQGTLASAEIYDPATGSFTATDSMTTPRSAQTATLLPDGTVLVAGGNTAGGRHGTGLSQPTGTAELFKLLP
jgi:Galactose oxidase, central domain